MNDWQQHAKTLKELFGLEYSPVAVACVKGAPPEAGEKKVRICRAILDAGKGASLYVAKDNNACFGASWHLGFHKITDPKIQGMIKKFVVEGEKLFCSYEALDTLMAQIEDVPDNSGNYFALAPMETASFQPEAVIFVVDAQQSCRLLTFVTFFDGRMPHIKMGGPTCRLSIIYPLVTGEANISFYDYTARKLCNVEKDKLLVSLPYAMIPKIVANIDRCCAGTAKLEYPSEFRAFLQRRLTPTQTA